MTQRKDMTSLSEPFQIYSALSINGSASAHENYQNACSDLAESSRKRGRSEVDEGRAGLTDCSLKRTSSSPYPTSDLLLSLGSKVPEAAGVEVSMKALKDPAAVQVGELGLGSLNGSSLQPARSLNTGHHNELIARLLAAASVNSREKIILQASSDPLQVPLLADLTQGQPYNEQGINRSLTRVNSGIYLHHPQGFSTLNDHNLANTNFIKPFNTMPSDALIKPYPCYNINIIENNNINTSDPLIKPNYPCYNINSKENNNMPYRATPEEGVVRKVAMQRHVMVVMEGRSIERALCLHDYDSYDSFAKALFEMFNNGTHDNHLINSSITPPSYTCTLDNAIPGYKIAYQDHEGDLLLAGDIPWREFIRVAKQIKILPMIKPKHVQSVHCMNEP